MEILAQTVHESYFVKQQHSSLEQNKVRSNKAWKNPCCLPQVAGWLFLLALTISDSSW